LIKKWKGSFFKAGMKKLEENLNFYRKILILTAAAYLIFAAVYKFTAGVSDPMSLVVIPCL
jgi:hypothetical protein